MDSTLVITCSLVDTGAPPNSACQDLIPEDIPLLKDESRCRFVEANESPLDIVSKILVLSVQDPFRRVLHLMSSLL